MCVVCVSLPHLLSVSCLHLECRSELRCLFIHFQAVYLTGSKSQECKNMIIICCLFVFLFFLPGRRVRGVDTGPCSTVMPSFYATPLVAWWVSSMQFETMYFKENNKNRSVSKMINQVIVFPSNTLDEWMNTFNIVTRYLNKVWISFTSCFNVSLDLILVCFSLNSTWPVWRHQDLWLTSCHLMLDCKRIQ